MSAGERHESEGTTTHRLGLERLSPTEIWLLGQFVVDAAARLKDQYETELRETLVDMPDEARQATIEQLATSEIPECRGTACSVIAYYAERQPDVGFPLWQQLMKDGDSFVRDEAARALSESLGVLDLDPNGVVRVIDAYYEGIGGKAILPPEGTS